jgi:D-sedoheptulose 7-phosphate isomerase
MTSFIRDYIRDTHCVVDGLDQAEIEKMICILTKVRGDAGRLFILGVGGGAGNAAHAVNDFRKICGIESYSPTDNVSELTARVNDDGWDTSFVNWLKGSHLRKEDGVFIFSVGGGNAEKCISMNLV